MYLGTVILAGHEPARAELLDSPQGLPDQRTASAPQATNTHSEDDSRIGERYAWLCTLLGYRKEAVAAPECSALTCGNACPQIHACRTWNRSLSALQGPNP